MTLSLSLAHTHTHTCMRVYYTHTLLPTCTYIQVEGRILTTDLCVGVMSPMCVSMGIYICMSTGIYICMSVGICLYFYGIIYVCLWEYICVCLCEYIGISENAYVSLMRKYMNICMAVQGKGQIFTTDIALAVLMAAPRSVASWDIVVQVYDMYLYARTHRHTHAYIDL